MGVGGPIGVGSSSAEATGVEERPAEVAGGGGGAAGGGGRSHGLFPAAAGTGAGSVGRRARAYAGGGERMRERERYERSKKDAGEGLRESWAFKWAFFPFSAFS